MVVDPCFRCRRLISARICSRSLASSAPIGSSISMALGWRTSARPMATRCMSPPESADGLLVEQIGDAQDTCDLADRSVDVGPAQSASPAAERRCFRTPSCGGRARRTGTPRRCRGPTPSGAGPACRRSGCRLRRSSPVRRWRASVVVLPQPDWPSMTTNSLAAIVRFMSLMTWTLPNHFWTPRSSICVMCVPRPCRHDGRRRRTRRLRRRPRSRSNRGRCVR